MTAVRSECLNVWLRMREDKIAGHTWSTNAKSVYSLESKCLSFYSVLQGYDDKLIRVNIPISFVERKGKRILRIPAVYGPDNTILRCNRTSNARIEAEKPRKREFYASSSLKFEVNLITVQSFSSPIKIKGFRRFCRNFVSRHFSS